MSYAAATTELVKCSEVGRFLGKDSHEVRRMTDEDGLPAVTIPGRSKETIRIFLPDLHAWLIRHAPEGSRLREYRDFLTAFRAAQPTKGKTEMLKS